MARSKQNPFNDPFDKLNEWMLLHFTKRDSRSIHWCHISQLEGNGEWSKYANPKMYLYAIEDLGRGSDGRVWLMCTYSVAVCCVLKFPIKDGNCQFKNVEDELKNWQKAHLEFATKVIHENWCGRWALRMPHFSLLGGS
jgi:hypothetical protein